MDNNDFRALIELRDDMEEPEDKQLLRRTIRHIERTDRKISEALRILSGKHKVEGLDTDN
jgi:hypothetical protein